MLPPRDVMLKEALELQARVRRDVEELRAPYPMMETGKEFLLALETETIPGFNAPSLPTAPPPPPQAPTVPAAPTNAPRATRSNPLPLATSTTVPAAAAAAAAPAGQKAAAPAQPKKRKAPPPKSTKAARARVNEQIDTDTIISRVVLCSDDGEKPPQDPIRAILSAKLQDAITTVAKYKDIPKYTYNDKDGEVCILLKFVTKARRDECPVDNTACNKCNDNARPCLKLRKDGSLLLLPKQGATDEDAWNSP
ncbi:hypothetical protein HDK90DRAFT_467711 [Phyllosticta capitalensis]|uniref:Uncharacterized protein n=1 Tax=Phyllosticta capitalensis TaxID=121624 RepID=A0ABR1YHG2_9PEZI